LLLEQRLHQMQRLDGGMIQADGDGLGIGQRELQLAGQTIDTHVITFLVSRPAQRIAP